MSRILTLILGLLLLPVTALAVAEYVTPTGLTSVVTMVLNGSSQAVPVSGAVPLPVGGGQFAYTSSTSASVATSSGTLFTALQFTRLVKICTKIGDTSNVWLNLTGAAAVVNAGLPVWGGGQCRTLGFPETPMPTSAITAITDGGSAQTVLVTGG